MPYMMINIILGKKNLISSKNITERFLFLYNVTKTQNVESFFQE